ncbi:hypothetical protein [Roseobacter sp. N2S]|uniref:hypothetical protein n=1 Tax=Roseobacter sp. N2S TaxID=2663844 RepID=UPI002859F4F8|nr:hypothetical protein [Roseobacter sp. N2S]MDR6266914.1 hypothetical protein [Roseobacter sp. N2S]
MQAICPYCKIQFTQRCSDQKFCQKGYRSLFGQKKARAQTPMNSKNSCDKYHSYLELFDRMIVLTELYHKTPIDQLLGFLRDLAAAARAGDFKLRAVLSNLVLINTRNSRDSYARALLHRHRFPLPIGKIVDLYCRHFWKASGRTVVSGAAPQPETGVVVDAPKALVS